jgi:hypothetical protein
MSVTGGCWISWFNPVYRTTEQDTLLLHLFILIITYNGEITSPKNILHKIFSSMLSQPWKPYWKGRLSMMDVLELSSIDQFFYIENIIYLCCKTSCLNDVNCTELSPSISIPWFQLIDQAKRDWQCQTLFVSVL